jgi:restriction endonuclease Mrr
LGDGQEHTRSEVTEKLAAQFALTEDERKEMLPSGRQARIGVTEVASYVVKKADLDYFDEG